MLSQRFPTPDVGRPYCLLLFFLVFVECCTNMLCQNIKLNFLCHKNLYSKENTTEANAAFQNNCMQTSAYLTFTRWLSGCHSSSLCSCGEPNSSCCVTLSLRPRHLIKRSKFSDEDATRMWSLHPTSHMEPVQTSASPLQSSTLGLRTIPRVQLTLSVHPPLPSNSFPEAAPPWKSARGWNVGFSLLTWTLTDC